MNKFGISYLITCSTETETLKKLLERLYVYIEPLDEVVIVYDMDANTPPRDDYINFIKSHISHTKTILTGHSLNKNYGAHKNWGGDQCKNPWIFQLDADERPQETLLLNIHEIILANPSIDLFYVARINDFIGVTEADAKKWGWRLTPCPACDNRMVVNWPDYQSRIYRRNEKIRWDRRLHEKIEGHDSFVTLPADTDLALYHDKTIETQLKTNARYNEWFSVEENKGHNVFDKKRS